ncbi:hypothetical protein PILCRDRAFT_822087 [Piloderma croceum F 1598]|uniref:tRNA-splicing endonuclease subunit Sen34 n=1 Tax=Piloderma croceum (strain F 1598) TaxID=765440 RepID=A0A0C3BU00_PILCF|nr:hypothetical protein PILCRDRAFT_822087 [Piloderma croceum F 1598]
MDTRIRLRVSNEKAYVWDVDDITTLRSKHHICGILTGTLPHLSQQNVFLGVPLVLMPEEVVFLVETELAIIIDDPRAHSGPSAPILQKYNDERIEAINLQISLVEAREAKEAASAGRAMSEEALRKRKTREQRKELERAKAAAAADSTESHTSLFVPDSSAHTSEPSVPQPSPTPAPTTPAYTVIVPPSSSSLPWYAPQTRTHTTLASARTAGVWTYPKTLHERAKCGVFRGLWGKGYFMGGGIKFGGDYLVYPGDPLRYHSHFVASVIDSPTSNLRPMEIVAHGRLGTATKKAHLLCGWDDEKQEVSYFSIEWAGFG